jgi:hypothetical protein
MDSDISHSVQKELDKINARLDAAGVPQLDEQDTDTTETDPEE